MDWEPAVRAAQDGELRAFTDLVRRSQTMVFGYAFAVLGDFHLAEDAAQEAYITMVSRLGNLKDPGAFPGWLRGIVRNRCFRILRGRRRWAGLLEGDAVLSSESTGHVPLEREERRAAVRAAVRSLPPREREAVVLFYLQGHTQKEAARFLGVPLTTINNRLHQARSRLKRRLFNMVADELKNTRLPEDFADAVGEIVKAAGPVVEAQFRAGDLPDLFDSLKVDAGHGAPGHTVHVVQHLDDEKVRGIVDGWSGDIKPGAAVDFAEPAPRRSHSPDELERAVKLLGADPERGKSFMETGIKIVDLLSPLPSRGNVAFLGGKGVGKIVFRDEIAHRLADSAEGLVLFNLFLRWDADFASDLVAREKATPRDRVGSIQTCWIVADPATDPDYPSAP
ncbi:MAG: RNA polymerase sigma factor, partial [Planctomycetota bacterium]